MSLEQLFKSQLFLNNRNIEVFNILFQIYATLNGIKNIYTHYDLHPGNISFVPVPEGKTILILYYINGKQYNITTRFIPVIIDYGRSHIDCRKFGNNIESKHFANVGCSINNCKNHTLPSKCATNSGLLFTRDENGNYSSPEYLAKEFLIPAIRNISHDVRYLYYFMDSTKNFQDTRSSVNIYSLFYQVNEKTWFNQTNPTYYKGAPEVTDAFGTAKKIKTVHDAINWLISLHPKIYLNNPIVNAPKFGTMNIYPDMSREWTFTQ
jgi:hypothetical protein